MLKRFFRPVPVVEVTQHSMQAHIERVRPEVATAVAASTTILLSRLPRNAAITERMTLAAVIVSAKVLDDEADYDNSDFVSENLQVHEVNLAEREFLVAIDWRASVFD